MPADPTASAEAVAPQGGPVPPAPQARRRGPGELEEEVEAALHQAERQRPGSHDLLQDQCVRFPFPGVLSGNARLASASRFVSQPNVITLSAL